MTIDAKTLGEALLAVTFETTIAKTKTLQVRLADFPIEAAIAFMQYGVGRKFNDAVGGSDKTTEVKVEAAEAMMADWKAGKIGRQAAVRVPDEVRMTRTVVREAVKGTAKWAEWKDLPADELAAKLDEVFAKQGEEKQKAIMAEVARRIKVAKAKPEIVVEL